MNVCDICSQPLSSSGNRYSATQIKEAVRKGLRPGKTAYELGEAFGMSKQETERGWINKVMDNDTDWLLCDACKRSYDVFAGQPAVVRPTPAPMAYAQGYNGRSSKPVNKGLLVFGVIFGAIVVIGLVMSYLMATALQRRSDQEARRMAIPPIAASLPVPSGIK